MGSIGDVPEKGGEHRGPSQSYGRDRQLDGKLGAVTAQRRQLDPLVEDRALTGLQKPPQPLFVGGAVALGNDRVGEPASDDLRLRPAEGRLRLRAPAGHPARRVDRHDGIERGLHDQPGTLLAFAQGINETPVRDRDGQLGGRLLGDADLLP